MAVLGTVSMVQSARQHSWQVAKLSTFATCALLLVGTYGMVMAAETQVGWAKIVPQKAVEDFYGRLVDLGGKLPGADRPWW